MPPHLRSVYEELRQEVHDPAVLSAVDRVIKRSRRAGSLRIRLARRIRRAFSVHFN